MKRQHKGKAPTKKKKHKGKALFEKMGVQGGNVRALGPGIGLYVIVANDEHEQKTEGLVVKKQKAESRNRLLSLRLIEL